MLFSALKSASCSVEFTGMDQQTGPTLSPAQPRNDEGGVALIWALFFVSLTTGVMLAHSIEMTANRQTMDTRYRRVELAQQVASSGLTDATSYLRRQTIQPVANFTPQLDLQADPPVNETLDPSIGLVREFEIHGSLWGRYEVRSEEAVDLSNNYEQPAGSVWDVGARGYLYEVVDPQVAYDEQPNRILSVFAMRTEIRGFQMRLPADAAVIIPDPDNLTLLNNSEVVSDSGIAVAYQRQTKRSAAPSLDDSVTGSPVTQQLAALDLDLATVFGIREDKFQSFADVVLETPKPLRQRRPGRLRKEGYANGRRERSGARRGYRHRRGLHPGRRYDNGEVDPVRELHDQAAYAPRSLTLSGDELSLRGRMLLVINGDLHAEAGNNSDLSGIVYVKGDAMIEGPFTLRGTLIVSGSLTVGGSAQEVHIEAAPTEVTAIQNALSRYRLSRDSRPMSKSGAFVLPKDLWDDTNLGFLK